MMLMLLGWLALQPLAAVFWYGLTARNRALNKDFPAEGG